MRRISLPALILCLLALILIGLGSLPTPIRADSTVIVYPTAVGTRARTPTSVPPTQPPTPDVIIYPSPTPTESPLPLTMLIAKDRPTWGPANAKVTVVAWADFQCPVCGVFAREVEPALRARYQDRVQFMFRHFPLRPIHDHALDAALAATCIATTGDFWAYHDLLYQHQGDLSRSGLLRMAQQLKSKTTDEQLASCMDKESTAALVEADLQAGQAAGVRGTPTFFINGVRLQGLQMLDTYTGLIDRALAAAPTVPTFQATDQQGE